MILKIAAGAVIVLAVCAVGVAHAQTARKKVVGYVSTWKGGAIADTIAYDKLTHLNVAFENPTNATGDFSYNPVNDWLIARAHAKGVKVLVSIGGGGASDDPVMKPRYFDLISDAKRAGFVAKLAAYVVRHKFDGLDVDMEGPSINKDYGAFIHDLARALKPQGKLLTAALSQGYGGDNVPASVFADFDWVNVMAYDATGPWNPNRPGQHSSLDMAKASVAYWHGRGLPPAKTVLGVPFYGYGFGADFNQGGYTFADIVAAHPGAERLDQVGNTIWYNGLPTLRAKVRYVVEQKLGGIMIWSLEQDAPGSKSLLSAIGQTLSRPAATGSKR